MVIPSLAPRRPALRPLAGAALLALTPWLAAVPAAAQTAEAQASQQLNRQMQNERDRLERERQQLRERGEKVGGTPLQSLQRPPTAAGAGGACHPVQRIEVVGAERLSAQEVEAIVAPQRGQCVGAAQIEALLAALTRAYVDRGLIASRAYLPSQDLSGGLLKLQVLEGQVARVEVRDGGADSVAVGQVFPGAIGQPVQLRELEQGIDQINRLESNQATLDIEPGARPGDSVVVVKNQPGKPWRVNLGLDNHGSEATGRSQVSVGASVDHLLGLNDFWSLQHRESVDGARGRKHARSTSLDAVLPHGRQTWSAAFSRSHYATTVTTPGGTDLVADGDQTLAALRLDHLLARSDQWRLAAAVGLQAKESVNRLAGQRLDVSSRRLTLLEADLHADLPAPGGRLRLGLGLSQGVKGLGALEDAAGLPAWSPRAQFTKWRLSAQYRAPFTLPMGAGAGLPATFSSQWQAQHSDRPLYGSEQMSIGGLYSVRGFREQSLSGDRGWMVRNELGVEPAWAPAGEPVKTRVYLALDAGEVRNLAPGPVNGALAGAAVGVQLRWRGLKAEIAHSAALKRGAGMSKEGGQTWLALSHTF